MTAVSPWPNGVHETQEDTTMAEEQKNQDQHDDDIAKQAESDAKLNAVVKSHLRRELKAFQDQFGALKNLDQSIAAAVAKALETKPADDKKADKSAEKGDPQIKLLMEKHEKLERELKESRDRAAALETKAKKDGIRAQIKAALEAKGIKGTYQKVLVTQMEAENVREDEEGNVRFAVSRSRSKGSPVEELEFDINTGIEDWCKTDDASDFLPPPKKFDAPVRGAAQKPVLNRRPESRSGTATELSEAEAAKRTAQMLEAKGINWTAILDE
jgi:hypothetical protein